MQAVVFELDTDRSKTATNLQFVSAVRDIVLVYRDSNGSIQYHWTADFLDHIVPDKCVERLCLLRDRTVSPQNCNAVLRTLDPIILDGNMTRSYEEIFEVENDGNGPHTTMVSRNRIIPHRDIANDFAFLVRFKVNGARHVRATHMGEHVALENATTAIDKTDTITVLIVLAVEVVIANLDICVVHEFAILLPTRAEIYSISLKSLESNALNGKSRYPYCINVVSMFPETVLN